MRSVARRYRRVRVCGREGQRENEKEEEATKKMGPKCDVGWVRRVLCCWKHTARVCVRSSNYRYGKVYREAERGWVYVWICVCPRVV